MQKLLYSLVLLPSFVGAVPIDQWDEEEEGSETHWISPRMPADERKRLFKEIEQLYRDGMNHLRDAEALKWRMPDVNAQRLFEGIIADCIANCVSKSGCVVFCTSCIMELKSAVCQKNNDWYRAQELVEKAKKKYAKAEQLEEKLWFDEDAEDWM